MRTQTLPAITLSLSIMAVAGPAAAQTAPGAEPPAPTPAPAADGAAEPGQAPAAEPAPKPKPPPYSAPFKLRPVVNATAIVSDTAVAKYEDAKAQGGVTFVETILGSYKLTPEIGVLARVGIVQDTAPSAPSDKVTDSGAAVMNPVLGGTYSLKLDDFRLGFFLGLAFPVGGGGGDNPDVNKYAKNARVKGVTARASMDNAMFAVNDFVVFPGVGFAYVKGGLTVQVEATLLQLFRARGSKNDPPVPIAQNEATKTNMTTGLHVGYFVIPELSLGGELHYQRWLNGPQGVDQAKKASPETYETSFAASGEDQASFEIGPRFHFKVGDIWIRPGLGYERGIDLPMASARLNYHNVQLHIPVIF